MAFDEVVEFKREAAVNCSGPLTEVRLSAMHVTFELKYRALFLSSCEAITDTVEHYKNVRSRFRNGGTNAIDTPRLASKWFTRVLPVGSIISAET